MNGAKRTSATVASLLTPPGTGAVAVVSLVGPGTLEILKQVFQPAVRSRGQPGHNEIVFGRLGDERGWIDDGLVAAAQEGGHWRVEINTHGSWRVLQRLMTRLGELGAEVADAGAEPDGVAAIEGDGLERDLWATLARCRTRRAVQFVTTAAAGLSDWLGRLSEQRGPGEAGSLGDELESLLVDYGHNQVLIEGVRVALVGPRNAGKSTLANRLLARRASLESPVPGTTRDWVEEPAILGGVPTQVVDTAGLGPAGQVLEEEGVRRGLLRSEQAEFCWFVVDPDDRLPAEARRWLAARRGDGRTMVVVNKIDLPGRRLGSGWPAEDWSGNTVRVSARTGEGMESLERLFLEQLELSPIRAGTAGLVCQRQAESVRFALARCKAEERAAVAARLVADLRGLAGIE